MTYQCTVRPRRRLPERAGCPDRSRITRQAPKVNLLLFAGCEVGGRSRGGRTSWSFFWRILQWTQGFGLGRGSGVGGPPAHPPAVMWE